ncbi:MAG: ATP cone domain-containing protein, partial [Spirochaetota bacterium]
MPIQKVKKRNGQEADFDRSKIKNAILRALEATGSRNSGQADRLTGEVVAKLEAAASGPAKLPGIEDIQDIVEQVLMDSGYTAAAKAYILYRQKHTQLRSAKRALGGWDHEELKLDLNAITILERRYLLKDSQGNITESPSGLFRRVARAIASVDSGYGHGPFQTENIFYRMMASREFLPNSPTLMNA